MVYAGYIGIAVVDDIYIRCNSFDINAQQEALFYDHIFGLNDYGGENNKTKNEEPGKIQIGKKFWRPSPIKISGSMSFVATENNISTLFDYAKDGNYFDINFIYNCNNSRKFLGCRINTFELSCTAGDVVNISADVLAKDIDNGDDHLDKLPYTIPEKIITWEKVKITGVPGDVQSFSLNINNSANPIYTGSPLEPYNKLMPADIRLGTQLVTGEIIVYNFQGSDFIDQERVLTLSIGNFSTPINVIINSRHIGGSIGAIVTNLPFVGVGKVFDSL